MGPRPASTAAGVALALTLAPALTCGETFYRCQVGGRTIYSATPTGPGCETRDLHVPQADPAEVDRQRLELEDWNLRREAQVQRILDREATAETQRRQSELKALGPAPRFKAERERRRKGSRGGGGRGVAGSAPAPAQVDSVGPASAPAR